MKLRDALAKKLNKKQLLNLKTSYDVIGSIAVIEIPASLVSKEKVIGDMLIKLNKNIKTVVKKVGIHSGEFRLQKYKVIAGVKDKTSVIIENGIFLKLHIEKTYYSPRMGSERQRIFSLVKPGERVLVMFSGIGPYVFGIAKNTSAASVVGVEINPFAHKFAVENQLLNKKLKNVEFYLGDVTKVVPKLGKFDRVIMPLPKNAVDFLDVAISACSKGATVHMYDFLNENEFDLAAKKVLSKCPSCTIISTVKCGQYGPRRYRICVDFKYNG